MQAETVLLRIMLRIVVHHKTNVSHDHMRQPVHTRVKLVVCCTLHAWWLHTSHCRAPTAIFLVPVWAPCYISPGWSYMWLRWADGEHCVLTRLWFHSTPVADVTLLPAEALCCLSQSTRLMVSVRWHTTAFSIVYKISRSCMVIFFCEAVYEVHVGLDLMREFGFT